MPALHSPPISSIVPGTTGTWRQQLLCLWLANSDLGTPVIAWSRYDGASDHDVRGLEEAPPYRNAVAAMRDGWRVVQMSLPQAHREGTGYTTGYLPHAVMLERFVEIPS